VRVLISLAFVLFVDGPMPIRAAIIADRDVKASCTSGIATVIPGERLAGRAQPMIEYLKVFERAANRFPGFENKVQGRYRETATDGTVRFYTYVVRE
jgi:hypothetical protein